MLYKNTKAMVHSLDTNFFNIVVGVLHGDSLTPNMFMICLDCEFQMSIYLIREHGFTL